MKKEKKYIILFKLRKFCFFLCETFSLHHILKNHSLQLMYCIIFTVKKGNPKLEETKEQKKEEMVLFSIEIRWKRVLCPSFRVTNGKITLCFLKSFHDVFVSFISILLSAGKEGKRGMRNSSFFLWTGLLFFFSQFSFEYYSYVHHYHLLVDSIICEFVKHFNE